MADAANLSKFLAVAPVKIPRDPDQQARPKLDLVTLARNSRRMEIRQDLVPRPESGRQVGPAYSSRLIEFVASQWRPEAAAERSHSLMRALSCLKRLVGAT